MRRTLITMVSVAAAVAVVGGVAAAGCSVHSDGKTVASVHDTGGDDTVLDRAWDSIERGADKVADAGAWTVRKTSDGATVIERKARRVAGRVARETSDQTERTEIEARLASKLGDDAGKVHVHVNDHIVELHGTVRDEREARDAVRVAMNVAGVNQVNSYLTWPRG
jgi:BON domain-containing protein